jgi:hypothetical protein
MHARTAWGYAVTSAGTTSSHLVGHGRTSDLVLLEWFLDLLEIGKQTDWWSMVMPVNLLSVAIL